MSRMFRLAALLFFTLLACQPEPGPSEIEVSWQFSDGRPCDLAGVVEVYLRAGDGPATRFACVDGLRPEGVVLLTLGQRPATVSLEGRSITGALLYRDDEVVGAELVRLEATLRFVGGEAPPRR